jgi:hypothetical protein
LRVPSLTTRRAPAAMPARYTGKLSGTMLQVTVSLDGGSVGTYEVDEGKPASFGVCNY